MKQQAEESMEGGKAGRDVKTGSEIQYEKLKNRYT